MRLAFKSVDGVKQTAPLPHSGWALFNESLNRTGRNKRELSLSACLQIRMPVLPCLSAQASTGTHTTGSPGSRAFGLGLEWYHQLSRVSSFLAEILGLNFQNHLRRFLTINFLQIPLILGNHD